MAGASPAGDGAGRADGDQPAACGDAGGVAGHGHREFGARFFAQGARPGFLLSHPGTLTDAAYERLKKNWDASTLENAHKTRIIEEGMKVEQIGIPPEEAQFLETRRFQAQEVARCSACLRTRSGCWRMPHSATSSTRPSSL